MKIPYLNNERGNTLMVVLGLLIAAIFISFIFFDFFTTFANKRVSQTGADAAALGAAQKIKEIYDAKLDDEIEERMDQLREEANHLVDELLGRHEDEEGNTEDDEGEDESEEPEVTEDEAWEEVLDEMDIPDELRDAIRYPWADFDANEALKYLFHNPWYKDIFSFDNDIEEINDVVCEEIVNTESEWREAARYYAVTNGAKEDVDIDFIGDEFRVYVRVKREPSFITVDESLFGEGERDIYAEAEASIKTPTGIDIICD
ncbi:MAG: pilus assembly protein TadG-related protein [Novibacillus thermophilus]|jgi:hypothetical protein|uniref:Putative Flp pilus-assembly TadG-like N-terminal domain-containing protein n=1 Tax=Novibacillus thermophilus TaxID=1471761 RepID=A0A1U9K375_9BACL|nr:pilus assembly protein TadG-related protein [Novibacillus thermophilus]AQS54494.1 hypothetical protein B0W44_00465 [Novibacillus thermophilus]